MKANLLKLGVMMIASATLAVGCTDSVLDASDSDVAATYDAYDATLLDESLMVSVTEVPTVEQALLADSTADSTCADSLRMGGRRGGRDDGMRGGPGGRGGHRGGRGHGHDGGIGNIAPLGIRNYRAAAAQLGLSAAQDSLFRAYLADLRSCAEGPAATYRAAREAAFAPYKPTVDSIRAAVRAGTITHDEARTRLDAIRAEVETVIAPLNEELRTAVASCRATFEAAVAAMLTAEQLELWNTLKG